MKKIFLTIATLTLAITGFVNPTFAEYPEKPVTFIVPWPPGDLEDILTRMIAEDFQKEYGVAAAVVNKPGGGGGPFPGAIEVANAPADGYTIGSFVIGVPVIGHQIGIEELAPAKFDPLGIFVTYPFVIATSPDSPYQTMAELAAYAKENDVSLGHFGAPLIPTKITLAAAKKMDFSFASDAAFDMLDCNTLASGDADVINTTLALLLPCLDNVTVLASITGSRISLTPDAPTVMEIEPTLTSNLWNGLFVHKDTPQDVRDKIIAVASKTVMSDRAQEVATNTGAQIYWMGADESAAMIAADIEQNAYVNGLLE